MIIYIALIEELLSHCSVKFFTNLLYYLYILLFYLYSYIIHCISTNLLVLIKSS